MTDYDYHWSVILAWALATVAGVMLGILSSLALARDLTLAGTSSVPVEIIGGAAFGGSICIAQWLVLRQHLRAAAWWVLVSVVGGMVGMALGPVLADALRPLLAAILGK